jgi:Flp pilus assembly protein TadG
MKLWKNESGQVLVLAAMSMTLMMGFAGLAIDVGMLFHVRRNMQIAADAAALAGAVDYKYNASSSSAIAAAKSAATANGITDLSDLTVSTPPADGPNKGTAGFVEAVVAQPNPTWFMSLFGMNSVKVTARAVAGDGGTGDACIYVLNPTATDAMDLQGSFVVNAPGCGVVVDSTDPNALQFTGASGTLSAKWVSVVGGDGGHSSDSTPSPVTGGAPVSDPLNLTGPTPTNGGCTSKGDGYPTATGSTDTAEAGYTYPTSSTGTITLAGNVTGPGIGQAVCFSQPVVIQTNATVPVNLGAGIYVFEQGVTINGANGGEVNSASSGTTLDIQGGALAITTNTTFDLVAPTAGETNGVVIMEPVPNTNTITIQKGNAVGTLTGIIYAPDAQLYLQDSGCGNCTSLTMNADIIVGTLYDKTATIQLNQYSPGGSTNPLTRITLVE